MDGGNYAAVVPESTAVETANLAVESTGRRSVCGKAQVQTIFQGNEPMYYVIPVFEKGGWALISARNAVDPLLGYSFDAVCFEGQPEWIRLVERIYRQIKTARQTPALQRHYRWAGETVTRAAKTIE